MKRIIVLEPNVANKIAAGEVVERPASIVKELVENSIDAGSTAVTVEIRNGGIDYIRVTDNGGGIDETDVPTAFLRHATGKISTAEELNRIETFGFRGEALASIAAVSKVSMRTRETDADNGTHIEIEGGKQTVLEQCGCPCGTTIEVNSLFFNVPARLKFLKSSRSEAALIGDYLLRLILSNTDISIKFINNGRTVYHSYGDGSLENALFCVYDSSLINNLYKISYDDGYVKITGFTGSETTARSTRTHQSVFVNRRYIKSQRISLAVQQAYDTRLMNGKYPFFVLNITISPYEIDVNVHPNKLSIRFKDEQRISSSVTNAVKNAFAENTVKTAQKVYAGMENNVPSERDNYKAGAEGGHKQSENPDKIYKVFNRDTCEKIEEEAEKKAEQNRTGNTGENKERPDPLSKITSQFDKLIETDPSEWSFRDSAGGAQPFESGSAADISCLQTDVCTGKDGGEKQDASDEVFNLIDRFGLKFDADAKKQCEDLKAASDKKQVGNNSAENNADIPVIKLNEAEKTESRIQRPEQIEIGNIPYTVVGVAFDTYIIIQQGEAIYFIDQHAAHERMLYEQFISNEVRFDSQQLLMPEIIKIDSVSIACVKNNADKFAEIGFSIEFIGETELKVSAVPAIINCSAESFILEAVDNIAEKGDLDEKDLVRSKLIQLSCKKAVKAGDRLEKEEIDSILQAYSNGKTPLNCPHGRPVIIKLSKTDLEKMFKRIV